MIWFALRVSAGREDTAERIIKGYCREMGLAVEVCVPFKHVVRAAVSRVAKQKVYARPILPGILLLGVRSRADLPVTDLERFAFVHGFMTDPQGSPLMLSESDIIRILGELHQRPITFRTKGRKRKPGTSLEIADGPYAGRVARVTMQGANVLSMMITGTTKDYDGLAFDNDRNELYKPKPDAPLAVANARR